ncbi:Hypothetical predicted protein [Octopus vulgaris]|uniref:Uncharacterized protein n=1 Tax=Octopus vulgaris TaxID=6645 RepID=A0AA36AT71_OCTVU|nr:Hypothetical predicted protein [Octopus vulgaris]
MVCKEYGWSAKNTDGLQRIWMVCNEYGWSAKNTDGLQRIWMVCKEYGWHEEKFILVYKILKEYRNWGYSLQDESRKELTNGFDPDALAAVVEANPAVTVREPNTGFNVNRITILCELKKLGKVSNGWKRGPHGFSADDRKQRVDCCAS